MAGLNRIVLGVMFLLPIVYISFMAIMDANVFTQYKCPDEYVANLATCKGKATFKYHSSPFIMMLTSYSTFPLGIFLGLQYRYQFRRGWSNPWVDNYDTTKYVALKWTMRFLAGLLTLLTPFLYACFFSLIFGKTSFTFALFFSWIPIVFLNGFFVTCGLHTALTRGLMSKCGFPQTQDNNYLDTSNTYSVV